MPALRCLGIPDCESICRAYAIGYDWHSINTFRLQNCNVEGNGIRDTVSAANLVQQVQFNGLTVRTADLVPARLFNDGVIC